MSQFLAPELQVSEWLNSAEPVTLAGLRGRVVLIEVFQMLCPGCVSHGIPQALRVAETFGREDVVVLGLHSVFEHHKAQGTRDALSAFLHEYRVNFPVGIDAPSSNNRLPRTMITYAIQGTPSTLLIDREGYLRKNFFGRPPDMGLGAEIMSLVGETGSAVGGNTEESSRAAGCDDNACRS